MDTVQLASDIGRAALQVAVLTALPMLLTGLAVGVIVSVLQAATQIQEQTLSFIPKILAMMGALYLFMPMLIKMLVEYARTSFLDVGTVPF